MTIPQVARVLRELLPRQRWSAANLVGWLAQTQARNAAASNAHAWRRQRELLRLLHPDPP